MVSVALNLDVVPLGMPRKRVLFPPTSYPPQSPTEKALEEKRLCLLTLHLRLVRIHFSPLGLLHSAVVGLVIFFFF